MQLPQCRAVPRWTAQRLLLTPLLVFSLLAVVYRHRQARPVLSSAPLCRPNMAVRSLPPASDDDVTMLRDLFVYLTRPDTRACRKVAKLGGKPMQRHDSVPAMDGQKYVCMDREFSGLLTSCLVYSVGVGADWSFDWDAEYLGCHVISMDPSVSYGKQGGNIKFVQEGIGARDEMTSQGWPLRTLESALARQGHARQPVHVLKMDIEGAEWEVLRQQVQLGAESALASNVQQLAVELHMGRHVPLMSHISFYREAYATFLGLQSLGFYPFSYEQNYMHDLDVLVPGLGEKVSLAIEVAWLKTACPAEGAVY